MTTTRRNRDRLALATTRSRDLHRVAGLLMGFTAATLVVAAVVHLAGYTPAGARKPFDADQAGIAEAVIAVVLTSGLASFVGSGGRRRTAALGATGFAIVGFLVGLSFTIRGGDTPDIIYHALMLPVLIVTLIVLVRAQSRAAHEAATTSAHRSSTS